MQCRNKQFMNYRFHWSRQYYKNVLSMTLQVLFGSLVVRSNSQENELMRLYTQEER